MAQHGIESAQEDLKLASEQLLLRTAQAFYAVLTAQRDLEAQKHDVERLAEHRRLSDLRFKVGEVTEAVVLRADAELARAQAELVAAENLVVVSKHELRTVANLPEEFELQAPPLPQAPADSVPQLIEAAATRRDDLKRSRAQEQIAEEQIHIATSELFPTLSLEGKYFTRNQDPRSTFFVDQSWSVDAKLEFPLFEGGRRLAERAQARARLAQAQLASSQLRKTVSLEVQRASLNVDAVSKVLQARQEQQRFAKRNYEIVSSQFTFGLATNIDALDANQALIEAERDVNRATYQQHLAILELQRAVGVFLRTALGQTQENL